MIEFTDAALDEIRRRRTDDTVSTLRVAARMGGCGSFEYFMEYDRLREGDEQYPLGDLTLVMDRESVPLLEDTTVDYAEGDDGPEFTFDNPRASPPPSP